MKTNHKTHYLSGILIIAAALALSACNSGPATLSFETIGKQTGYINNVATASSIEVVTSRPAVEIANISPEDLSAIQSVDYFRYFTLVVVFGHGYYNQDSIAKISQLKDVIWVETNLSESGTEGGPNYQIVKVPKADMILYGKIIFRLLDNQMGEIAKAVQTIPQP